MFHFFKLILVIFMFKGCLNNSNSATIVTTVIADSTQNDIVKTVTDSSHLGEVYEFVEQNPSFPGGEAELLSFISKNFNNRRCIDQQIQGRIHIEFIVEVDGTLSNGKMTKGPSCQEQDVKDFLIKMPKWTPGTQNGEPVRVKYTLPIIVCWKG